MKRTIAIGIMCAGILLNASAQTYTQRIQHRTAGKGTVTIHQSSDIDQLVNEAVLTARTTSPETASATAPTTTNKPTTSALANTATANAVTSPESSTSQPSDMPVDNTKKIMKGYKVNGYRVQAFAGGNTRKDRILAEQTGDRIKDSFPEVPVYVHFYSPRWICRVGNYRTYEEAHQMLVSLRNQGFTQATIVKGKITVQY
ncbi:MAG: SPOR domain-containing protein [Prevotella sp.]|nr:SPOR domain-containing protein [Prevotella sp.]